LQAEQAARQLAIPPVPPAIQSQPSQNSPIESVSAPKAGAKAELSGVKQADKGKVEKEQVKDKHHKPTKTEVAEKKEREDAIDVATRNLSGSEKARVESVLRHSKIDNELLKDITKDGFSINLISDDAKILRDKEGKVHEGVFNYNDNKIRLSESAFRDPKELEKVLNDELGHRIDDRLRENPETSAKWSGLMKDYAAKESKNSKINENAASNQGEFGSEVISSYLRGGKDEQKLKDNYPELYDVVKQTVGKSDQSDLESKPQGLFGRFIQAAQAQQNQLTGNYFTANLAPGSQDNSVKAVKETSPSGTSRPIQAFSGSGDRDLKGGETGSTAPTSPNQPAAKATTESGGGSNVRTLVGDQKPAVDKAAGGGGDAGPGQQAAVKSNEPVARPAAPTGQQGGGPRDANTAGQPNRETPPPTTNSNQGSQAPTSPNSNSQNNFNSQSNTSSQSNYSNSSNYYNSSSNYYNQSSNSFFNNSNLSSFMDQSLFSQFEQSGLSSMLQDNAFQSLGMAQQDLMALDQSLSQAGGLQELQKLSQGLQGLDGLPQQLKGLEGLKELAPFLQNVPETLEGLGKLQNLVDRAQNLPGNPKDFARNPDVRSLLQDLPNATRQVSGLGGLARGGSALFGQMSQLTQVRQVGDNLQQLGKQTQEWKDLPSKLDQVSQALPLVRAAQQEGSLPTAPDANFGQLRGQEQGRRDERPQSAINPTGRSPIQGENLSGLKTASGAPVGSEGPMVRQQPIAPAETRQQVPGARVRGTQGAPAPLAQQPAPGRPQGSTGQHFESGQPVQPQGAGPASVHLQASAAPHDVPPQPGRGPAPQVVRQPGAASVPSQGPVAQQPGRGPAPIQPHGPVTPQVVAQQPGRGPAPAQSPGAATPPVAQQSGQAFAQPQGPVAPPKGPAVSVAQQPGRPASIQPQGPVAPQVAAQQPVPTQGPVTRTQYAEPVQKMPPTPTIAKLDMKMTQRLQSAPMLARQLDKLPQAQKNLKTVVNALEKTTQHPKGLEALHRTAQDPGSLHKGLDRLEQLVQTPEDKANVQNLRKTLDPVLTDSKMRDGLKQADQALKPLGESSGRQQVLSLKRVQLDTPATREVSQQLRQPAVKAPMQRVSEGVSQAREMERATEAQNNRLPHLSEEMTQDLGESLAKIISEAQAANRPRSLFGIQLGGGGARAAGPVVSPPTPPPAPARAAAPARPAATPPVAQPAAQASAQPAQVVKAGPAPRSGQPKENMSKARIDAYRQTYETVKEQMIGKSGKDHAWALVYHSRDAEGAKGLTDTLESNVVKGGSSKMQSWFHDMTKTPDSAVALSAILANVANVAPDRMMGIMLLTTDGAGGKDTVGEVFNKMSRNVDSSLRLAHFLEKSSEHPAAARGLAELLEGQTEPQGESWKSANRTAETFRGISETVGGARRLTQTLENLGEVEGGNRLVARTINRMTREPEGAAHTLETLQNLAHDKEGAGQLGRVLSRASESRDGARDLLTSFQGMAKSTSGKQDVARLFVRLAEGGQGSRLLANFVKDGNNSHQLAGVFEQLNQNKESKALLAHALDQMAKNPRQRSNYEIFAGRVAASETLQAAVHETTGENEKPEGAEVAERYPEMNKLRPLSSRALENPNELLDPSMHKPADLQRVSDNWRVERPSAAESQAPAAASALAQAERPADAPAELRNFRPGDVYSEETLRHARICGDCGGRTTSMGLCPRCATRKRSSQAQAV
jgi:hypothetical protein